MKIHFLSNSLKTNSGFAIVTKNLAQELKKLGHVVTMSGMQTSISPEYTYGIKTYPIPSFTDEGSQFKENLMKVDPDVVIYVGEMYTDLCQLTKIFPRTVCYIPVEDLGIPHHMIYDLNTVVNNGGRVVAQCSYGFNEMVRHDIQAAGYIYHGYNEKIFKPLDKSELIRRYCFYSTEVGKESDDPRRIYGCYNCTIPVAEQIFCPKFKDELITMCKYKSNKWTEIPDLPIYQLKNEFNNKFVYLLVGQNHRLRKKIDRLLMAFSLLLDSQQMKDKLHLHLHTQPQSNTGINLLAIASKLGIENNVSFTYGSSSEEAICRLYNVADVAVTASSSEGFCILPDSPILTLHRGVQKIKDIKIGDKVLTHKGRFMRVSQVMKREYIGDMIEIIPHKIRIPITLTPEHYVLGIKTKKCESNEKGYNMNGKKICRPELRCYYTGSNGKRYKRCQISDDNESWKKYELNWIQSKHLKEGDYVTYPVSHENEIDITKIKVRDYIDDFLNITGYDGHTKSLFDYLDDKIEAERLNNLSKKFISMNNSYAKKYAQIPFEIELTKDLMRLFGYFIAEGDINDDRQIAFTFNINEHEYINDVEFLMKNIFGLETEHVNNKKIYGKRINVHILRYSNKILSSMFQNMFCPKEYETKKGKGRKANIVRIPPEFLNLPLDKLKELIKGIWRGDGGKGTKGTKGYNIKTTSETLAHQLVYILTKFGIFSGIRISKRNNNINKNWSLTYIVEILGDNVDVFERIINEKHQYRDVNMNISTYIKSKGLIYVEIDKINVISYNGEVWNLEVEEDNSYVSSVIIHNCLPILESMACGIPQVTPDCTSMTELIGNLENKRGLLAKIGDSDLISAEITRQLVDISDLSTKMKEMYTNKELRKKCSENCLEFVKPYTWNQLAVKWDKLIKELVK